MEYTVRESEYRLLCIIWDNEPLTSRQLVEKASERLGWKKSTTYTVLKWLVERGFCVNESAVVSSRIDRSAVQRQASEQVAGIVNEKFGGSLPCFLTAFIDANGVSDEDAEEIMRMLRERRP